MPRSQRSTNKWDEVAGGSQGALYLGGAASFGTDILGKARLMHWICEDEKAVNQLRRPREQAHPCAS